MSHLFVMLIFLSLLAGTGYYIAHRLYQGFVSFFPGMHFAPILILIYALALILILGFIRALTPFPRSFKRALGLASAYTMGIALYLLLFTVAFDLLLLIPRIMKLSFTTHRYFNGFVTLGVLLLTAVISIYGFVNARQIDHVSYQIQLQDKKDISDLNIVMISDLHLGAVGSESRLRTVVDEINAKKPDVVCISGDFFDTDFDAICDPETACKTLQEIRSTYGVYACLGNHDGGETFSKMTAFLEQADVHLLKDDYTVIDDRLILVGRLNPSAIGGYDGLTRQPLSSFFVREDPSLPVIVLDHDPANITEYHTEADLILCGHTHRGHVFPGNLFTKFMYTVDYGHYQKDAQSPHVIVSSGVGTWGMPMRVGTNCEVVSIHISCDPT